VWEEDKRSLTLNFNLSAAHANLSTSDPSPPLSRVWCEADRQDGLYGREVEE
jgi:hypothetical protein